VREKVNQVATERGFRLLREAPTDTTYIATYVSDEKHEIKEGDTVQLGFCVRNSIDTTLGFGIDVFTFRGLCKNGAIFGLKSQVKLTGKHTKLLRSLWESLPTLLERALQKGREVIQLYRKMSQIQLNETIAQALESIKLPHKYTETIYENVDGALIINPMDVWTAYNKITEGIWHAQSTDERSKYLYLTRLHSALMPLIQ
jgi:hypothetical protein